MSYQKLQLRLSLLFITLFQVGFAQQSGIPCTTYQISGQVIDEHDNTPLGFASIYYEEGQKGVSCDETGHFELSVCAGEVHLVISHLNCENRRFGVSVSGDTVLVVKLEHHSTLLATVTVQKSRLLNQQSNIQSELVGEKLDRMAGQSLAAISAQVSGVQMIRTGTGISKPVIHGLYGNRIAILQNGTTLGGQNWGADHAPELDPFQAGRITVLKGSSSVKYGEEAFAGAILVDPSPLPTDEHLHGSALYSLHSNSRSHTLAVRLEGGIGKKDWHWRLQTSGTLAGDYQSPRYPLTNTGHRNTGITLHTGQVTDKGSIHFFGSYYQAETGILRSAHIGNISDLLAAYERETPFVTDPVSYSIKNPRQTVQHGFLQTKWNRVLDAGRIWKTEYTYQINSRQEFDVRRAGRDSKPSLDMLLQTHQLAAYMEKQDKNHAREWGVQYQYQQNYNIPGTGVRPLIPFYNQHFPTAYILWSTDRGAWQWDAGARVGVKQIAVKRFDASSTLFTDSPQYLSASAKTGWAYKAGDRVHWRFNAGISRRSPQVNELFSEGLHHASASIEEGNSQLKPETGLKLALGTVVNIQSAFHVDVSVYWHQIYDFIYLQPSPEPRLTIRGAFPVFTYVQTNTRLLGADVGLVWDIHPHIQWENNVSVLEATRISDGSGLFGMPPLQWRQELTWLMSDHWKLQAGTTLTGKQNNVQGVYDLVAPPDGYTLLQAGISYKMVTRKRSRGMRFALQGENLLNTSYRDYLNRLRYFSDDTGRNISLQYKIDF